VPILRGADHFLRVLRVKYVSEEKHKAARRRPFLSCITLSGKVLYPFEFRLQDEATQLVNSSFCKKPFHFSEAFRNQKGEFFVPGQWVIFSQYPEDFFVGLIYKIDQGGKRLPGGKIWKRYPQWAGPAFACKNV
jgi:hypothetical protein